MDNELLDSLIEMVINDKERVNDYKGFEKLIESLSKEEILYFLNGCKENLFLNIKLAYLLIENIPTILKEHVIDYTDNLLKSYEQSIMEISNNDPDYDKKIKKLTLGRTKVERFRKIYLDEINNKLKK